MSKHPAKSDYSYGSVLLPVLPSLPLNQHMALQNTPEVLQDTADRVCGNGGGGKAKGVEGVMEMKGLEASVGAEGFDVYAEAA